MKIQVLLLTAFLMSIFISINLAYAQCGYHPPEPQAQTRQRSSVNIDDNVKDIKKLATITKKEAKKIAISNYPGKVKEIKLVKEEGTLTWKLEIKGKEGQKEMFIDPANGTFLGYGLTK